MKKLIKYMLLINLFIGYDVVSAETLTRECVKCGSGALPIPAMIPSFVAGLITLAQVLTPIILIVTGLIKYTKAVTSGEDKVTSEVNRSFIRSVIAAIMVFLIIALVKFVFRTVNKNTDDTTYSKSCVTCFITGDCPSTTCPDRSSTGLDVTDSDGKVTLQAGCYYDTKNEKYLYKSKDFKVTIARKNTLNYIAGKDSEEKCKATKCTTYKKKADCKKHEDECTWTAESTNKNGGVCSNK